MRDSRSLLAATLLSAACLSPVHAETSPWSVRVGPASVAFDVSSSVAVAGTTVPGGEVQAKDNLFLGIEIGYTVNEAWAVRLALGVPPTTTLSTGGTLNALVPPLTGTLGKVKYGPAVLSANYTLGQWGPVKPYVGLGVNYTMVMESRDGDIAGLNVKSAWGSALELGLDWPITPHWSVFADARKVFVKTSASGTIPALGGLPATADVKLNPLIVHTGIGYRF
jgi:outer membrane protein